MVLMESCLCTDDRQRCRWCWQLGRRWRWNDPEYGHVVVGDPAHRDWLHHLHYTHHRPHSHHLRLVSDQSPFLAYFLFD